MPKWIFNIGDTVVGWTVLDREYKYWKNGGQGYKYLKIKHDCGFERSIIDSGFLKFVSKNYCRQCQGNKHVRVSEEYLIIMTRFHRYKENALTRGFSFEISKELFFSLVQGECFYCGTPPCRPSKLHKGQFKYGRGSLEILLNGVDRKDSHIGYTPDNVVSCCTRCNQKKSDTSLAEWDSLVAIWYNKMQERIQ
jgi:hypothetical protein